MDTDHLQDYLDLRRTDLDPEEFSAAIAVRHMGMLIARGGSEIGRSDLDPPIDPHHLGAFLACAPETARRTKRFER